MQRVEKGPLAFVAVGPFLDAVAELGIGPAGLLKEEVGAGPPAEADKVEVRRPGPGMFFRAAVAATFAAVKVDLSPWVEYEYAAVSAAVLLEQRPGLLVGSIEALPGREGGDRKERVVRPGG